MRTRRASDRLRAVTPDDDVWRRLADLVAAARRPLLVAHVNPDPDALGSALALADALDRHGADVQVSFDADPFAVPTALAWLPGVDEFVVPPSQASGDHDLVLALDCAAADRLGGLLDVAESAAAFAVLDHHASNPGFAPLSMVDPAASSTGELVARLLDRLGWQASMPAATALYAAIASDTGGFRFPATSAQTHLLAARLHDLGIDHADVGRRLFANRSLTLVQLSARVVSAADFDPTVAGGAGLLVGVLGADDRADSGLDYDDIEPVITDLAAVADADVAAFVKQDDHGAWRVSLRSKRLVDVGAVATALGGGGHAGAGGYTAVDQHDAAGVVTSLRTALDDPAFRRT